MPAAQAAKAKDNLLADSLAAMPNAAAAKHANVGAAADALEKHQETQVAQSAHAAHPEGREQAPIERTRVRCRLACFGGDQDKATRQTIDHYGGEILTTAALFAGGKVGFIRHTFAVWFK